MINLKQKIISELNKDSFPDLALIYSSESLDLSLEILRELLWEEKQKFRELLKTKKEDINFDLFEDEGILDHYWSLLNHYSSVESWDKIRKIIEEFRPELQDFSHEVSYSKKYFEMLLFCQDNSKLDDDQKRSLYLRIKAFKDRGIDLEKEDQDKLKKINKRLSKLSHNFTNNVIDDEWSFEFIIDDFESIKDLPKDVLESAKNLYKEKYKNKDSKKDAWLFTADPTSYFSIMQYCHDSSVRKYFEEHFNSFCSSWKYDNRKIILEILELKNQKSKLLWYKNYCELSLNNKMAESPNQVISLLEEISKKSILKAKKEEQELRKYFWLSKLNSYDLAYYSKKYKKAKYEIDDKKLKEYFEFENVLSYLHSFVKDFLWVELKKIDVKSYDKDVRVYEVYKSWKLISYYFLDPFYRKQKRSWAWADNLREKTYEISHLSIKKRIPIVVNVCNFSKPIFNKDVKKDITLLSLGDSKTMFHEFGHALHEILSESKYSDLSWFWVEWDFVELPSQLMENRVSDRESLVELSRHFKTGDSLSEEMLDKLDLLKKFNSWIFTLKQCEYALVDMNLYSLWKIEKRLTFLDKKVLDLVNKYSLFKKPKSYKMYASFGHIFSGGYSAWYYSYMWAEIIEAQVWAKIKKDWIFDNKVWKKLTDSILWQWTRKKASELFYDFTKEEINTKYFFERKWI